MLMYMHNITKIKKIPDDPNDTYLAPNDTSRANVSRARLHRLTENTSVDICRRMRGECAQFRIAMQTCCLYRVP